ncbi:MAG: cobalt-precorrin 5A hydrolase [Deltaproteobacteria bacterium]|nr:cobalt-precorrin 5A hydrolase [Deltaproteobacteria bacterium]
MNGIRKTTFYDTINLAMKNLTKNNKIALISVTRNGRDLARRLSGLLPECTVYTPRDLVREPDGEISFDPPLSKLVERLWPEYRSFVFVMATGIVVRVISGLITDKRCDPAVLVMDEKGRHVISLLSGHMGGANALTLKVAKATGADPVITTATDLSGLPAAEVWAGEMGLVIENPGTVRGINAALVNGDRVGIFSGRPGWIRDASGPWIPFENLAELFASDCTARVVVSNRRIAECGKDSRTLLLRPKNLVCGIGCNRGTGAPEIREFFLRLFRERGLSNLSVGRIATIDAKADEVGLRDFADEIGVPVRYYARDELNAMPDGTGPSPWALKELGVKGVCEQAAMKGAGTDSLVVPKARSGNVTMAVAEGAGLSLS